MIGKFNEKEDHKIVEVKTDQSIGGFKLDGLLDM